MAPKELLPLSGLLLSHLQNEALEKMRSWNPLSSGILWLGLRTVSPAGSHARAEEDLGFSVCVRALALGSCEVA